MEKVVRFYIPNTGGNVEDIIRDVKRKSFYLEEGVSFEVCTITSSEKGKFKTIPFVRDDSGKAVMQESTYSWNSWELDPSKQYYIETEFSWSNLPDEDKAFACRGYHFRMPKELVESMGSENVALIGLWDQWGDGEDLSCAIKELGESGFHNVYNRGKFLGKSMISRYAELQEYHGDIKEGPRISTRIIPVQANHQEPKVQPKSEKKVSGVVTGDISLLYGDILSLIRNKYEGCNIDLRVVKGDLRILVKDYKGQKSSQ